MWGLGTNENIIRKTAKKIGESILGTGNERQKKFRKQPKRFAKVLWGLGTNEQIIGKKLKRLGKVL